MNLHVHIENGRLTLLAVEGSCTDTAAAFGRAIQAVFGRLSRADPSAARHFQQAILAAMLPGSPVWTDVDEPSGALDHVEVVSLRRPGTAAGGKGGAGGMTGKRCVKLMMGNGLPRNKAELSLIFARIMGLSCAEWYATWLGFLLEAHLAASAENVSEGSGPGTELSAGRKREEQMIWND